MAVGTLNLTPMFAVREQDLSIASYDKNRTIVSKQWNSQTLRSKLHETSSMFDFSLNADRFEMTKEELVDVIENAFEIMKNDDLANDLKLFVEALTYNRSTEHSQSFVMSWSIIERYYSNLWENILKEKKLDKKRLDKLLDSNRWSIDRRLEILNLFEKINEDDYKLIMELKKKRNDFYHGKEQISKEDAVNGLKLTMKIIGDKLNLLYSK